MSYWRVAAHEGLPLYVWANDSRSAQRRVEEICGPFANGQCTILTICDSDLDEYDEVIDEPENEREERLDGYDLG